MIRRIWWLISPGVATRRERWLNRAMILAVLVALGGVAFGWKMGFRSWAGITAAIGVVATFAFRSALQAAHLRALGLLRDAQFLVCPTCRYGLHASVREGRCPECGRPLDSASLRKDWTQRYVALLNRVASPTDENSDRHRRMNP